MNTTAEAAGTASGALDRVAASADALLAQCAAFISDASACYASRSTAMAGSTIGQHVRHTLDHFSAALGAAEGEPIDYDHRSRGTPIENEPGAALALIGSLRDKLSALRDSGEDAEVVVLAMVCADGACESLRSTLSREIAFASHHAMHHHAMMGAIAREHGLTPPSDFGKAPSTLCHERTSGRGTRGAR